MLQCKKISLVQRTKELDAQSLFWLKTLMLHCGKFRVLDGWSCAAIMPFYP